MHFCRVTKSATRVKVYAIKDDSYSIGFNMKIVGFPIDVSRSQDGRIVRGLRTRQSLIQATLDLIQAGDVEPTSAAIATIAGVSSRALFQHFTSLADLYAAAFDLAVEPRLRPQPSGRQRRRRCRTASSFWSRTAPSCSRNGCRCGTSPSACARVAPAVGLGVAQLRRLLRERLAAWFATELGNLDPGSRDLVLNSLDLAFGLDSWMNMREQLRLSPVHASRTWRFTAEAIVLQALTVPNQPVAVA